MKLTGERWQGDGAWGLSGRVGVSNFQGALSDLETAVLDGCAAEGEWPAQVAAGIYAGIEFAIANPAMVDALTPHPADGADAGAQYERVIGRLTGFIRVKAAVAPRLPGADESMVAGIVGVVGDHVRVGQVERLAELRPDLILVALLPYLGFSEAQRWAHEVDCRFG
jgi:hypothetical protein